MVLTIFRSRLRPEHLEEYSHWAERIHELATRQPGFVSIKSYVAEEGERVSIVEFDSEATHAAWRNHPEHLQAQELGRQRFYAEYRIQVCTVLRDYAYRASA